MQTMFTKRLSMFIKDYQIHIIFKETNQNTYFASSFHNLYIFFSLDEPSFLAVCVSVDLCLTWCIANSGKFLSPLRK